MTNLKLLAFDGSTRKGSFNRMLLNEAIAELKKHGASVTQIKLTEMPLPFMDEDLEDREGIPANGKKLIELFNTHHGIVIASPEYNGNIPAILKNAIDWVSRADENPFTLKPIFLLGASSGMFAASRSNSILKQNLMHLGAAVQPMSVLVPNGDKSFDAGGKLTNEISRKQLVTACGKFMEWAAKFVK